MPWYLWSRPAGSEQNLELLTTREIIERVEDEHAERENLVKQVEQQRKQINNLTQQVMKLNDLMMRGTQTTEALQRTIATHPGDFAVLLRQGPIQPFRAFILSEREQRKQEIAKFNKTLQNKDLEIRRSQNANLSAEKEVQRLTTDLQHTRQEMTDMQFSLELLKHTTRLLTTPCTPRVIGAEPSSIPIPFVIVLVDGDAYKWNLSLSSETKYQAGLTAGALAAQNIKREVHQYMLSHSDTIPIQSKVIARVFCNETGMRLADKPATQTWKKFSRVFMKDFTESMPLFDFFDAGSGKERADEKIKENFHLFVSNPLCYTIFFAACTDNGFARLLEQYSADPVARAKIVLVTPGFVGAEIQRFQLPCVEWPQVFAHKSEPKESMLKRARDDSDRIAVENRIVKDTTEGETKYGREQYRAMLLGKAIMVFMRLFIASDDAADHTHRIKGGLDWRRHLSALVNTHSKVADHEVFYIDVSVD